MSELEPEESTLEEDFSLLEEGLVPTGTLDETETEAFAGLAALGRLRKRFEQLEKESNEHRKAAKAAGATRYSADARVQELELELEKAESFIRTQDVKLAQLKEALGKIASQNPKNRDRAKTLGEASAMARKALGKK